MANFPRGSVENLLETSLVTAATRQALTARLHGEDAHLTPRLLRREITARLAERFAREPETVAGAAHLLPLEAPAAVADFVRRTARTGAGA